MSIAEFVSHLRNLDIRLSAEGDRLRVNAPKGVLTEALRAQLADRKQELLEYLLDYDQPKTFAPPPLLRRVSDNPAPLSFAQERLWFLEQLEPGSTVYNICRAFRVIGELNVAALKSGLTEIVRRHEVLRLSIRVSDGRPVQVVQPRFELNLSVTELHAMSDVEREQKIRDRIQQAAEAPFDLAAGKFLRAELLRLADDEQVLILATHHIVSDAWSMGILTRELWELYEAYAKGRPSPLQELPVQYADYAVWQREWLQGDVLESQLSYWKEQLEELPILDLPTDHPRPVEQSFRGARQSFSLSESLTAAVNELSRREGVTQFMTLLAAFQVLLYRYSGQEDVVVGSPISNRNRNEIEGLIGFFVNTLILRADLSEKPTFKELLQRVRNICLEAYAHQDLPFEKLVQELQLERDLSRNPLFQVMFVLQNTPRPLPQPTALSIERVDILPATSSLFDLSLYLRERDGKLIGFVEYNTDLFEPSTVERMIGHFEMLLKGIVADPEQPISTLPLLTQAERHQVLVEWNNTETEYPKDVCIHELFEAQAARTPEAIALEFEAKQLTYGDLNRRANQLAHYLRRLGIGPEKLVGICMDRSIEMVIGMLGILKAGGAYVPLDPSYPRERLEFMLKDAQVSVLLTQKRLVDDGEWMIQDGDPQFLRQGSGQASILDPQKKLVCLGTNWGTIVRESEQNIRSEVKPDNLAYVIYTSGSTGQPKGVAIQHCNTVALLYWAKSVFANDELTGVLASTSICFDLSIFELFVPLSWGGKVILAENALHLHSMAEINEITLINTVPSVMAELLAMGELPASVQTVNLAGEALRSDLVKQIYESTNVEKVYDLYGPSETTTYSTFTLRTAGGPPTIGRPISNTRTYLLDENLQSVPIGTPGELYIGGAGVARGYLNRPDLTTERFISSSFNENDGERIYRTGDLARYRPDGDIEFLGRADNQVKIHGYRIELGEIEAVLVKHPTVKDCVVVASEHESRNGKNLVGYVVPREYAVLSVTELRSFLREKLPEYMIPFSFVVLEALPLMPNGKVDRNALPPPDDKTPLTEEFVSPRTEIEELIAQTWRDVLKIENVGIYDNFFELGGHSLLATQIVARLQEAFNKDVPLRVLFNAPTIAELAQEFETIIRDGHAPELPPIVPVPRDGPLPLSMNQEHLWRLDQIMPGTHFFNIPYIYRLSGSLNVEALERAVREIVRRHETLRTVFDIVCGQPTQVVHDVTNTRLLICHDLRHMETNLISDRATSVILEERKYPFQLATGPLFRVALVRLTETESLLLITVHHIVSDYWSMQIFLRELALIYEHIVCGKPPAITQPTIQFADYAQWERRMLVTGPFDKHLDFWRRQLAPPLTNLRFRKGREPTTSANFLMSHRSFEFDEQLVAAVKAFAKVEKCTTSMVFLTALNILLFGETRHTDMRVGLLMANRGDLQTAGTMGHFMNTVVIRTQLAPDMTCHQVLYRVRPSLLAAHAHQQLPFEYLANLLEEQDRINRASLFQVLVMYRYSTAQSFESSGVRFAPIVVTQPDTDSEVMMTTYDLVLDVRETSTKLTGSVNFSLGSGCEIVNSLAGRLAIILRQMISGEFDSKIETVADVALRNTGYGMPQNR